MAEQVAQAIGADAQAQGMGPIGGDANGMAKIKGSDETAEAAREDRESAQMRSTRSRVAESTRPD